MKGKYTLNKDRFSIEETFVKVKRCEEEHGITRRISQESKVMLVVVDIWCWAGEMQSEVE